MQQLEDDIALIAPPTEDAIKPEILRADDGAKIFPRWMLGVGWWSERVWPDMAEPAGHTDPVRAHQILVQVVVRIRVIALGIPVLARLFVEGWVGKQAQSDDTGGLAIVRTDRNCAVTARADFHPFVIHLARKRIR